MEDGKEEAKGWDSEKEAEIQVRILRCNEYEDDREEKIGNNIQAEIGEYQSQYVLGNREAARFFRDYQQEEECEQEAEDWNEDGEDVCGDVGESN